MKHDISLTLQERLFLLADGELPADDIGPLLDALEAEPAAYETWTVHHALAASVRGDKVIAPSGELLFWQSIQQRLDQGSAAALVHSKFQAPVAASVAGAASNESFWKVRVLASLAMVLVVGGLAAVLWPQGEPSEAFVRSNATVVPTVTAVASSDGAVMLRDPELDALMAAHQQMGGHSAWQAPSGFLRSATFERSGR
nr:hypothetical protein [uncultured Rhodoferax sp.]